MLPASWPPGPAAPTWNAALPELACNAAFASIQFCDVPNDKRHGRTVVCGYVLEARWGMPTNVGPVQVELDTELMAGDAVFKIHHDAPGGVSRRFRFAHAHRSVTIAQH